MKNHCKILGIISMSILGACTTSMDLTSDSFGDAVRHNIAAQHVKPTDAQKQNTFIRADAQRSALAQQRYKTDKVEKPVDLRTTSD